MHLEVGPGPLFAIVDAGGAGDAAERVLAELSRDPAGAAASPADRLEVVDAALAGGPESSAVLAHVSPDGIVGASVGCAEAWLVRAGHVDDLTGGQQRTPLVGTGRAFPIPFWRETLSGGTLILASDGLFARAHKSEIAACLGSDLDRAADDLLELVRGPEGGFRDDVAVILCR